MFERDLLAGQVVFVTGGGSGLGLSVAARLAELGARLFLVGRRPEALRDAAAQIISAGGECGYTTCDVRDAAAVEAAVTAAEASFGHVGAVVNAAAGNFIARTETLSPNAFAAVVGIVLHGTFHVTVAAGRRWIAARRPGTVLNIVTTYAETGSGFVMPSACAKAGVLAMTRSLAVEWARYGIRVNAIAPGPFPTDGAWSRLLPSPGDEERLKRVHPMKRFGSPHELANLAAYLLSSSADYINGACVVIDGGLRFAGAGFNHLVDLPESVWQAREASRRQEMERTR